MTSGAVAEPLNLVLLYEPAAKLELVGWRPIVHPENFAAGPHIPFRVTMTIETPNHLQRSLLSHNRHLVNPAVAGGTPNALSDMDAVIEVREVGQIMDARPLKRCAGGRARAERFQRAARRCNLRMAVHAGTRRRDASKCRRFNREMAVSAIDTVSRDMKFVAERDRLASCDANTCDPRRPMESDQRSDQPDQQQHHPDDAHHDDGVGALRKQLRHVVTEEPALIAETTRASKLIPTNRLWATLVYGPGRNSSTVRLDVTHVGAAEPDSRRALMYSLRTGHQSRFALLHGMRASVE